MGILSLANKFDVENVVDDIAFRINSYYKCVNKDWGKYSIYALFPTGQYLGSIYARYDIFQNEEKSYI